MLQKQEHLLVAYPVEECETVTSEHVSHEARIKHEELRLLGCYAVWLLLGTDVSKELTASFIRVKRIGELETTLAVTSNRRTLSRNTK
jgi:hypothetical protein